MAYPVFQMAKLLAEYLEKKLDQRAPLFAAAASLFCLSSCSTPLEILSQWPKQAYRMALIRNRLQHTGHPEAAHLGGYCCSTLVEGSWMRSILQEEGQPPQLLLSFFS